MNHLGGSSSPRRDPIHTCRPAPQHLDQLPISSFLRLLHLLNISSLSLPRYSRRTSPSPTANWSLRQARDQRIRSNTRQIPPLNSIATSSSVYHPTTTPNTHKRHRSTIHQQVTGTPPLQFTAAAQTPSPRILPETNQKGNEKKPTNLVLNGIISARRGHILSHDGQFVSFVLSVPFPPLLSRLDRDKSARFCRTVGRSVASAVG